VGGGVEGEGLTVNRRSIIVFYIQLVIFILVIIIILLLLNHTSRLHLHSRKQHR
jgi:uncharacterized membrane protein YvbJ